MSGGAPIFLSFLIAVCIHEGGHLAAAVLCGVPLSRLHVGPFGLRLTMDYSAVSYGRELCVLLAGSAAGCIAAWISSLYGSSDAVFCNLALGGCNLLPVRGLDGGAAVETILSMYCLPDTACRITRALSFLTVVVLWTAALWVCLRVQVNAGLLLLSIWFLYGHMRK